jgi:uncharacterized surface protein with fasciclin (FAS1) repeats
MATILEISNGDKNLSSFMKGIKAAGLEDTLNGIGPFTLLAPVNLAFGKIAQPESYESLLKQGNSRLTDILTFHAIKGKKLLKDFRDGQKLETVNGQLLTVTLSENEIRINGAKILAKDRQGFNGVVHTIDIVNMPAAESPVQ